MYKTKNKYIEAFQYTGEIMNKKGNWIIPNWAVYLYQNNKLYFCADKPFMPPVELYLETNETTFHVRKDDYIIKLEDTYYVLDSKLFNLLYEEGDAV